MAAMNYFDSDRKNPQTFMYIFHHIFLSNCWWQESDIWSQASYRYTISWVAFLDPSDSYFLFADLVDLYTHWTYMQIFRQIFLSNSIVAEKNATKNILDGRKDGRTEVKQYTPLLLRGAGV
jgi:hypothetical protein